MNYLKKKHVMVLLSDGKPVEGIQNNAQDLLKALYVILISTSIYKGKKKR